MSQLRWKTLLAAAIGATFLVGCRTPNLRSSSLPTPAQSASTDSTAASVEATDRSVAGATVQAASALNLHENDSHELSETNRADKFLLAAYKLPTPQSAEQPTLDSSNSIATAPTSDALPLTLDSAISVSLSNNPTLIALRAGEPVARAAYGVAETYPFNPFVQVQFLPVTQNKAGDTLGTNYYIWLMQTLELAHQRSYREQSASSALNQVRWNIVQADLTATAMTERLYFTALYQRSLLELAGRTAKLNENLVGVIERRFKAGLSTAAEQTLAKVAVRQSLRQLELADANYHTALLALQRQLNVPENKMIGIAGSLKDFRWLAIDQNALPREDNCLPDAGDFIANLARQRPDVLAAQSGVGVARGAANLARANQIQNFGIGPYYGNSESGTSSVGFRAQMNLPVWDTGKPLTAQRVAELNVQQVTFAQLVTRAEVEARTAIDRYDRARSILEREQAARDPKATDDLQSIRDQFASGQADILNVYAVQTSVLQEERTQLDLLNEVAQAAADVTLMTGLPPFRVITTVDESNKTVL